MKHARLLAPVTLGLVLALAAPAIFAHCQIPCGIYDDAARFTEMREHVTTIEKSMKQIVSLGAAETRDENQIVRWVLNKEDHADELAHIVTYYFMAQRIKAPAKDADAAAKQRYASRLALLHRILVESMKAKQSTGLTHVETLRGLIDKFETAYNG